MTELLCFIERRDRGDRFARVRLLGRDTDAEWTPAGDAEDPLSGPREAAAWVRARLGELGSKSLDAVCIDAEGGVCAWIRPPTAAPGAVEALIRRTGGEALLSGADAEGGEGPSDAFGSADGSLLPDVTTPGSAGLQTLDPSEADGHAGPDPFERLTVLAVRDAAVRVFLDELDRAGVSVGRVESLWHAMARAWDGGAGVNGSTRGPEIVAQDSPMIGSLIVQSSGRIAWCWSRGGALLAAGSARCAVRDDGPAPDRGDAARLVGDWMAWGAQLGRVPARMVCVLPERMGSDAGGFGSALAGLWKDAPIDAMTADDPAMLTLERERGRPLPARAPDPAVRSRRRSVALAFLLIAAAALGSGGTLLLESAEGSGPDERRFGMLAGVVLLAGGALAGLVAWRWLRLSGGGSAGSTGSGASAGSAIDATRALLGLTTRPGRTHRSMYRWTGLALVAAGVLAGIVGWTLRGRGSAAEDVAAGFKNRVNEIYQRHGTEPASGGVAVLKMEQMVGQTRQRLTAPTGLPKARPILQELDTLMYVLPMYGQNENLTLQSLTLDDLGLRLTVHVPSLEAFTSVREALMNIGGSNLVEWNSSQSVVNNIRGERVRKGDYSASWRPDAFRGGEP